MMAVINSFLLISVGALLPAVLANNSFSFFDALSSATAQYNKDSLEENAFKALGEHPLEGEDLAFSMDGLSYVYKLSFTLGETVCSRSEDYQEKQCTFKENGKVKRCTATVSVLSEHPSQAASVEVNCGNKKEVPNNTISDQLMGNIENGAQCAALSFL
ncbi:antimicrobial protein CAP18-like isoform X2 [Lepisosteus oculatus]|uniref:antimicrobial protein CAP18-like isoform X2 n=1 Tax=Lepisosteus oculatus TaxID=7918 RepID=UPI0007400D78|nr:PREDICTED: antimicrobial protein CAP18-like isoform X2 [Lepisosteus oculatus]